ncbi:MAG: hypothetical protein GY769_12810 [bacterium]|nr:hypothetical protein [bacterium]
MTRPKPRARFWPTPMAALLLVSLGLAPGSCGADGVERPERPPDADLVELFKHEGVAWIRAQREHYRPRATPLSEEDRDKLSAYFSQQVLDRARVLVVRGFDNPGFFSVFEERGEPHPIDLRRASAMALVDTILVAKSAAGGPLRDRLLFHELVHMVQYELLGLEDYMDRYVDGWAQSGRDYREIPHERQAFDLAARFRRSAGDAFSVETEVRSRFGIAVGDAPD